MSDQLKKGWRVWRFDQMATMVNDRIDDPAEANVEYYLGLEHLDPESLTIRRWGSPSDVNATKLLFRKGDIIFGRRRVYQRKLAVAHFDGICSAHALVLRAKPEVVVPEFLPFFMQSDLFMERAKQISVGSLSPTINWKTLAKDEFALPPMEEQRRITDLLVPINTSSDKYYQVAINIKNIKEKFVTDTFKHYRIRKPLSEVCELIRDGTHFPPKRVESGPLLLGVTNLINGELTLTENDTRVSKAFYEDYHRNWSIREGDILLAIVGATIGKTAIVPSDFPIFTVQRSVAVLRGKKDVLENKHLHIFLNSNYGQRLLWSRIHQTAQPGLYLRDLSKILIPIPSIEEQNQISSFYNKINEIEQLTEVRKRKLSEMLFAVTNSII